MTDSEIDQKRNNEEIAPQQFVLVLRTCDANLRSYGGFQWPNHSFVAAPDWNPESICGGGLHGLLWGAGNGSLLNWEERATWLVVKVIAKDIVNLGEKVKFPRGEVVFCGDRTGATEYIVANGGNQETVVGHTRTACADASVTVGYGGDATAGDHGTATAGDHGTAKAGDHGTATAGRRGAATAGHEGKATAGHEGTATAGDYGTATVGDYGTATAGDHGTATAGHEGTATAGDHGTAKAGDHGTAKAGVGGTVTAGIGGVVVVSYFNHKGQHYHAGARVRDGYGNGTLEPNVPYQLDEKFEFKQVVEKS